MLQPSQIITRYCTPTHPDDRMAIWRHKGSAYRENIPEGNLMPRVIRPVYKINLRRKDG